MLINSTKYKFNSLSLQLPFLALENEQRKVKITVFYDVEKNWVPGRI